MKSSFLILGAAVLGAVDAHYIFGRLIVNNTWTKTWEYVREITPLPPFSNTPDAIKEPQRWAYPLYDPLSTDIRCGRNTTIPYLSKPKVATIHAGDKVGFAAGEIATVGGGLDKPRVIHTGFASVWMSKSPDQDEDGLDKYAGDGDWFKILSVVNRTEQSLDWNKPENKRYYGAVESIWGTYMVDSWNFTIPATTPPGKYLLRFEHIYPVSGDQAQWYPNCAHVEIVNNSPNVGKPGPLVKIPGVYKVGQPDVYFNTTTFYYQNKQFIAPAPAVWKG